MNKEKGGARELLLLRIQDLLEVYVVSYSSCNHFFAVITSATCVAKDFADSGPPKIQVSPFNLYILFSFLNFNSSQAGLPFSFVSKMLSSSATM